MHRIPDSAIVNPFTRQPYREPPLDERGLPQRGPDGAEVLVPQCLSSVLLAFVRGAFQPPLEAPAIEDVRKALRVIDAIHAMRDRSKTNGNTAVLALEDADFDWLVALVSVRGPAVLRLNAVPVLDALQAEDSVAGRKARRAGIA